MPGEPVIDRYLPSPWDIMAQESGRRLRGTVRGTLRRSRRAARKRSDLVAARIAEVLITGCRDTQTSADAYIGGSYGGALTYALVAAIREAKGRLSYRELHARTLKYLKKEDFTQVPQLEARKTAFDRLFLA
jgi:hypothetical protein